LPFGEYQTRASQEDFRVALGERVGPLFLFAETIEHAEI
jgi:hypothetical protein